MNRNPRVRSLLVSAVIAAAAALAGCQTDGTDLSARALTPLSGKMLAEIEQKNMNKESPILVRIFKQEAELEVWKQDRSGRYALLKTYPVCRWSGELGPKIKEGDRQAPEGFYSITPAQMNPKSQYYLAFNIGYPNAYDRAWNRTGAELMIHGDCSSRGCYAMTDEQIGEIYALGREAFFGGQHAFQVQAYPFRMTPTNFAKHRNNPNLAFWKMLKRGNDHFEVTGLEPKIDVCEKHYVFNAQAPDNTSTPLSFNPAGKCPVFEVPQDIVAALNEKQRRDEYETAELVTRGTKPSPIRTGTDGGMHPVFLAALQKQEAMTPESPLRTVTMVTTPGTIPQHAVPPREPQTVASVLAANVATAPPATAPINARMTTAAGRPIPLALSQRPAGGSPSNINAPANARAAASVNEATGAISTVKAAQAPKPRSTTRPVHVAAPGATPRKPAETIQPPMKAAEGERAANAASVSAASFSAPSVGASSGSAPSILANSAPMQPAGSFESRWSAITGRGRF